MSLSTSTSPFATGTLRKLERVAASAARRRHDLPAPQILVTRGDRSFASGERSRRFHAASVGKMMTATVAFCLAERGVLDLDAPVDGHVDLSGLVTQPRAVTARMLLSHTSGAADYFDGAGPRSGIVRHLLADPSRRWTPEDLLDYSREHQRPIGAPGEKFRYSDTGYVALGRVLEAVSGQNFGALLHQEVFAPAGMGESCLMFHTSPGGGPASADPARDLDIAPLFVGKDDFARGALLSCDWAGGGVVTTLDDLTTFSRTWHAGGLLGEESRRAMTDVRHRFRAGIHTGTGAMVLRYREFFPLLRMPDAVGHLGVSSAHLFAIPEKDVTIAMNFHGTREMTRSFRTHIALVQSVLAHGAV